MHRLAVLSLSFARVRHSRYLLAVHNVIKVVKGGRRRTHLESVCESQTSDATASDDDLQSICHGPGSLNSFKISSMWTDTNRNQAYDIKAAKTKRVQQDIGWVTQKCSTLIDGAYLRLDKKG